MLAELLQHEEQAVRVAAAAFLGRFGRGAADAQPALVRALDDPDQYVRAQVRMALSKIDPERYPQKEAER